MTENDTAAFFEMLDAVCEIKAKPHLSPAAKALWFATVQAYPMETVQKALSAVVQSSSFMPQPSEVIAWMTGAKGNDGRPGLDEAWAMAHDAMDESLTVVLTPEIIGAMGATRGLMLDRDQVAARKAFQEVYDRMVREARNNHRPISWQVQLGTDRNHQQQAINDGIKRGRLKPERVSHLLPAPEVNVYLMLENKSADAAVPQSERDKALEALDKLRKIIAQPSEREIDHMRKTSQQRQAEEARRQFLAEQAAGKAA